MNQETQDKAREELIKRYEVDAFEALANYNYYGQKLKPIEKGIADAEKIITDSKTKTALIEGSTDRHTKENRERKQALIRDIEEYEKRIKSMRALGEKAEKEVIGWREVGVTILEKIENLRIFKLRTPEEIQAENEKQKLPTENNQESKS